LRTLTPPHQQATEGVKSLNVGSNPFAAAANPFAAAANPFKTAPTAFSGANPFAVPAATKVDADDEEEEEDDEEEQDYLHQWLEDKPDDVRRRVIALEVLHQARNTLHAQFSKEVYELEKMYQALYAPLYDNRSKVVNASTPDDIAKDDGARTHLGLPDFWLVALKNSSLSEEIYEQDEPVLKALTDIRLSYVPEEQGVGFTIDFHFKENEFFSNAVLSKTYIMQLPATEGEPADFDDEELQQLIATPIVWKSGKNTTVKVVTKKQKKGKQTRTVTKNEPCPSFFSLFDPLEVPSEEDMEVNYFVIQLRVNVLSRDM
jgi:nucleosome assembly protein 1-like 1